MAIGRGVTVTGPQPHSFGSPIAGVRVIGTKEAIAKLRAVAQLASRELGLTTYQTAQRVQMKARDLVPVEDGHLQSGIQLNKQGVYDWAVTASSLEGGADREYAAFVEFGTWKMAARPFLRPAASDARAYAQGRMVALARRIEAL